MEDKTLGDFFTCEDYQIDTFTYKDIKEQIYCLKSSTTDFDLTGQIIWDAAIILAKYIIDQKELFEGKNIVELGAGAGLSGLVATNYAKNVILTDNNEVVLNLLCKNEKFCDKKNLFVQNFNWGKDKLKALKSHNTAGELIDFAAGEKLDIVMGADVIFWPESLEPLMQTLQEAFEINPHCLVLISFCSRTKSVDRKFFTKLEEYNMKNEIIIEDGVKFLFKITKNNT